MKVVCILKMSPYFKSGELYDMKNIDNEYHIFLAESTWVSFYSDEKITILGHRFNSHFKFVRDINLENLLKY